MDTKLNDITLFLVKTNCTTSESIKGQMTDLMWQSVKVDYTTVEPFLLTNQVKITNPIQIINYLESLQTTTITTPSTLEQVNNARLAATKALRELLQTGTAFAPPELVNYRRALCSNCPFKVTRFLMQKCSKCGCHIKSKTTLATEACPLNKW